ncbi:glycoside hydrolase family protein [Leptobacterium flavescens]|uniref:Lysozyme n=1 Tax=Leptobacterium flavescens TaxID=472055 RepID=A0A6P0UJS3_9FLAO|nr:lysozyme [Leptobacterium flavescens]NER13555.1 glycoside hydrolase family protein [Leptobacterium flavescens]
MKTSQAMIDKIKEHEGFRAEPYLDPPGVLTIGYGHTKNVTWAHLVTKEQAEQLLKEDVAEFEGYVSSYVKVPITQSMFDALVSFSFNVGSGALKNSTLLKRVNEEDHEAAAKEFLRWNKATVKGEKVVLPGLTKRREFESYWYTKDMFIQTYEDPQKKKAVCSCCGQSLPT